MTESRDARIRELNRLCERELLPAIQLLDSERKSAQGKALFAIVVAAAGAFCHFASTLGLPVPIWIVLGIVVGGLGVWSTFQYGAYRRQFKREIMSRVIEAIFPGFDYAAESSIPAGTYQASQLFLQSYDRYRGEDYCRGRVRETDLEFSELHTEYKVRTKNKTSWHTIFRGVFVHAEFHKNLQGRTFVVPDTAEKLFGNWLGGLIQDAASAVGSRGERVQLENPEFERHFAVTGTNPQEARYVLTPSMQENILKLKARFGTAPYLSFIGGRVFVAIEDSNNHFEPSFWRATNKEDLFRTFAIFASITEIVDDLDLNTRIWTKD